MITRIFIIIFSFLSVSNVYAITCENFINDMGKYATQKNTSVYMSKSDGRLEPTAVQTIAFDPETGSSPYTSIAGRCYMGKEIGGQIYSITASCKDNHLEITFPTLGGHTLEASNLQFESETNKASLYLLYHPLPKKTVVIPYATVFKAI